MKNADIINERNGFFMAIKDDLSERVKSDAFNGVNYCFDTEDSFSEEFRVQILRDRAERNSPFWRIAVCGVFPDSGGRVLSHFIFKGTLDEVVEYFISEKFQQEIYDEVLSVDASIKKHD